MEAVFDGIVNNGQIQKNEADDEGQYKQPARTRFLYVQGSAAFSLSTARGENVVIFNFCTHCLTPLSQPIRTKPRASSSYVWPLYSTVMSKEL